MEQRQTILESVRPAAEGSPVPTVFTRGERHVVRDGNQSLWQLLGASPGDVEGKPLTAVFQDERTFAGVLDRAYQSGVTDLVTEVSYARGPGRTLHFSALASPVVDARGIRQGLVVRFIDTTDQVTAQRSQAETAEEVKLVNEALLVAGLREQELAARARQQTDEVNALLENMTEGVAVFDGSGRIVLMNPVGRAILGFSGPTATIEDYRGQELRSAGGQRIPFEEGGLCRALRGETFSESDVVLVRPDGAQVHLLFSGSAVRDVNGNVALAIALFRDVTTLRELEATREEYVALVSHDLRGPLSAARMSAEALLRHPDSLDIRREMAGRMIRSLDRMDRMVRDLLDAHRIRAGKRLPLVVARCDLAEVARDVADELTSMFGDRFVLDLQPGVEGFWSAEELRRAVWNLGSNAVKYGATDTPIVITARRVQDQVRLSVHNEGSVIPFEFQPFLFRPFSRKRPSCAEGPRGWGLGLTLVRGCAEAHGGRVSVRSEAGHGTTFTMKLPLDARPYQTSE